MFSGALQIPCVLQPFLWISHKIHLIPLVFVGSWQTQSQLMSFPPASTLTTGKTIIAESTSFIQLSTITHYLSPYAYNGKFYIVLYLVVLYFEYDKVDEHDFLPYRFYILLNMSLDDLVLILVVVCIDSFNRFF